MIEAILCLTWKKEDFHMKRVLMDIGEDLFRLALLEDGEAVEFYVEDKKSESLVGNIYIGRIENVIANLQAAFVDIGIEKKGYLYYGNSRATSDTERSNRPKSGEEIVVQVEKDAIGTKGPVLSRKISLSGKFLVLLPQEEGEIGISRKITQNVERERIHTIIAQILPKECGVIVRTNGAGRSQQEFEKEMSLLLQKWQAVSQAQYRKAPALLWQENIPALKAAKDFYSADVDTVVVNEKETYDLLQATGDFGHVGQPVLELYTQPIPLFANYYAESKLEKALSSRVWLKSGGYLVIEETEACVVIDVNSAKAAGRGDLEKMIYKTNLEAAEEAARQMRLRNLSGIIIIDFIDMIQKEHQEAVTKALVAAVAKDRIKAQVVGMTQLGLMQVTRKKTRPSLLRQITIKCNHCDGSGKVFSRTWIVEKMRRETRSLLAQSHAVEVHADARLLEAYLGEKEHFAKQMQEQYGISIVTVPEKDTPFGWYDIQRVVTHHKQ